MGIQGTGLSEKNTRLRFFVLVFMGIMAFGAVIYWRNQTLATAEYTEFPVHQQADPGELHSKNYQIDVEDASPTVK